MKYCLIILLLALFLFFPGCVTSRSSRHNTAEIPASVNNALTQHDSQISKLTFQFNKLNETNRTYVDHINRLNKQIAVLNQKITTLETTTKQLAVQLESEKTARRNDTDRLLKEVAKQTAMAINAGRAAQATRTVPPSSHSGRKPAMSGEFYEYTVQPGATLGAIARAYKVSVDEIRKANKLNGDIIRVGEKLYIPKH